MFTLLRFRKNSFLSIIFLETHSQMCIQAVDLLETGRLLVVRKENMFLSTKVARISAS